MGWRYRRSINMGGFRINISSRGIGYSVGIPGLRYTHSANGSTYTTYSIPGTGLSYRQTHSTGRSLPTDDIVGVTSITSARIGNYQSVGSEMLLKSLNKAVRIDLLGAILLGVGFFTIVFGFLSIWCLICGAIGIVSSIVLMILSHSAFRVKLTYEMDSEAQAAHNVRIACWEKFFSSKYVWQINTRGYYTRAKVHGGANEAVTRTRIHRIKRLPFYLKTNCSFIYFKLQKEEILILPDKMLIRSGYKFGALDYDNIDISAYTKNFIEDMFFSPHDTIKVGDTWQYVNKNGTPDRRFNNNRLLPVNQYGYVGITSESGLNILLSCSNPKNILDF